MAKSTGLAWTTLGVGDSSNSVQDIRNDVTNLAFTTPRAVQDVTGIDKSAKEVLLLLADFTITLTGVFNPAANLSHAVFSTVPSTSVLRTVNIVVNTKTLDQSAAVMFTDYANTRATGGEFTWTAPGVLGSGAVPTWS
jgi:hypothetical protein